MSARWGTTVWYSNKRRVKIGCSLSIQTGGKATSKSFLFEKEYCIYESTNYCTFIYIMNVIAELREMGPNDVWFIRLFFCPIGETEQYSIEGNLYRNYTFRGGESVDNVFHAVNARAPHTRSGYLTMNDNDGEIEFHYLEEGFDQWTWHQRSEYLYVPCRAEVLSRTPRRGMGMGSTGGSMDGNPQFSKPLKLLF